MGLFDSAKDVINAAKKATSDTLGEDGIDALKNLKDSVVDAGSQIKKSAVDTWNNSENETISKARNFLAGAKKAVEENEKAPEKIVITEGETAKTNFVPALCTQCGASLDVDPSQEAAVCQYCGTAFIVEKAINKYNVEHAEIHAEKVEIHKKGSVEAVMDYLQDNKRIRSEEKEKKRGRGWKIFKKIVIGYLVLVAFVLIVSGISTASNKKASAKEEAGLQKTVEEIQNCIDEGRYDEALVKANGLYYTSNYSNETKKKWDNTRETLIATIEEAKQEQNENEAEEKVREAIVDVPATPAPTTTPKPSATPQPTPTPSEESSTASVSYSTNDKSTVKNGNTGIYSYKNLGGSYDVYYIIDFDEGYVYYFCDGNGDATCERVKIVSGTLNDVVIITYHDGVDTWSNGLHFKWSRQPDHLVVEDQDHYEWDFYDTFLDKALQIRDSKSIKDY